MPSATRLNLFLARAGVASRRAAEKLITEVEELSSDTPFLTRN
jgi:16S rRNA U516 pseudouridylate synthase RsuA-like enzyme